MTPALCRRGRGRRIIVWWASTDRLRNPWLWQCCAILNHPTHPTIYSSFCLSCFISSPWHHKCCHLTVQGLLTPSEGESCSDRVNKSPHESSSALNAMGGTERWSEIFIHSRPESTSAKATTRVWTYSSTEHSASAHTIFSRGGKMQWLSWFIL